MENIFTELVHDSYILLNKFVDGLTHEAIVTFRCPTLLNKQNNDTKPTFGKT